MTDTHTEHASATTRRRFHTAGEASAEWIGHADMNPRPDAYEIARRFNAYPALLDALRGLATAASSLVDKRRGSGTNTESALRIARTAIEKAEKG